MEVGLGKFVNVLVIEFIDRKCWVLGLETWEGGKRGDRNILVTVVSSPFGLCPLDFFTSTRHLYITALYHTT